MPKDAEILSSNNRLCSLTVDLLVEECHCGSKKNPSVPLLPELTLCINCTPSSILSCPESVGVCGGHYFFLAGVGVNESLSTCFARMVLLLSNQGNQHKKISRFLQGSGWPQSCVQHNDCQPELGKNHSEDDINLKSKLHVQNCTNVRLKNKQHLGL